MSRRTRIKICGIGNVEAALSAAAAGADAVGLVFVEQSPRRVDIERARQIVDALPAFVEPVGLFMDADIEQVQATARQVGLRTVQLHGQETPADVAKLERLRVIKAISFDKETVDHLHRQWGGDTVHRQLAGMLFDAPPPDDAPLRGGSGHRFDWQALAELQQAGELEDLPPLMLAGGLNAGNVAEAIATVRPYAVDVSTGVESSRGVKDIGHITAFCQAVRAADKARHASMV